MLIISAFCLENFKQKGLVISILLRLRMLTYAYVYALVKTSLKALSSLGFCLHTKMADADLHHFSRSSPELRHVSGLNVMFWTFLSNLVFFIKS